LPVSADEVGLSFGRVVEIYDRVRPQYPKESFDRARQALELDSSAVVLDLAAGTGRLTKVLAERFDHVIAVEPDDAMRTRITDGEVLAGTAEAIPLPDSCVDAVFVAEAFHWFDASRAVPEIERVLRGRGGLAVISNGWWDTVPALPDAAEELLRVPYVASGRAEAVETWREIVSASSFEPLRDETFRWELDADADTLLGLYQTTSSIAALPEEERQSLVAKLRAVLGDTYTVPICTELTWTRLPE
jgi:ubiquinone/menaquinone biosynthesis C-methylase UbiE